MNISKQHYQIVAFPIFLILVVFVLWASLMKIGQFVRGYGKIVPSGQIKYVQHLEGGILSDILISQGQQVKAGQPMFRIRNEFAISSLGELEIGLFSALSREARLKAELSEAQEIQFPAEIVEKVPNIIANERQLFLQKRLSYRSTLEVLVQQQEQRKSQLQEDRARLQNLRLQYEYAKEQQNILERLVKSGAGSQKELIDSKLKAQEALTSMEDVQNRMITNERALAESVSKLEDAKNKHFVDIQAELSLILVEIQTLKEQINANRDRVSRTDVLSPVDGVVRAVYYTTIGGVVSPGDVIAEVIPSSDIMLIDARINPKDRANVWIGQSVNIKITAYDSILYGQLTGRVIDVSADTFLDEGTRAPYYAVTIESNITGFGSGNPLHPGMIAEVNIVAGERTLMSYIFKPLLRVFDYALTEP